MSDKREVRVNFADRDFRLVRKEFVYEVTDDNPTGKLIRNGGDLMLQLAGHTAGSWEAYKTDKKSFNTLEYQKKFLEENNYATLDGKPAVAGKATTTNTRRAASPRSSEPNEPVSPGPTPATAETPPADNDVTSVEGFNLTPEQQAALKVLQEGGHLDRIIGQKIDEKTKELSDKVEELTKRVNSLQSDGNRTSPGPKVMGAGVVELQARNERRGEAAAEPTLTPGQEQAVAEGVVGTAGPANETWVATDADNSPGTAAPIERVRKPRGWFGRRWVTDEEWSEYRTKYQNRNRLAAGAAALAAVLAGGWAIWATFELEDVEATAHRIEKKLNDTISHEANTPQSGQENSSSGTNSNSSGENSAQGQESKKTYFENSKAGGHGLQLDMPSDVSATKNQDGSYDLKLASGKHIKIHWNRQGKLSEDSNRILKENHYGVKQKYTAFTDRENDTYTHRYSVISDQG
jgi:hypothetical protein